MRAVRRRTCCCRPGRPSSPGRCRGDPGSAARQGGAGHRAVAAHLARDAGTVRGWLRRVVSWAELTRVDATCWVHALGPVPGWSRAALRSVARSSARSCARQARCPPVRTTHSCGVLALTRVSSAQTDSPPGPRHGPVEGPRSHRGRVDAGALPRVDTCHQLALASPFAVTRPSLGAGPSLVDHLPRPSQQGRTRVLVPVESVGPIHIQRGGQQTTRRSRPRCDRADIQSQETELTHTFIPLG